MSIGLALIVVVVTTYVGYSISSRYKVRYRFYNDILVMFKNIRQNLNFKQDKLVEIFENEKRTIQNKELNELIQDYIAYLKNKNFEEKFIPQINILNANENEMLTQIFNSLGRNNLHGENINLDFVDNLLKDPYENTKDEYTRYSNMYIKLGFFVGCFIVIIFI